MPTLCLSRAYSPTGFFLGVTPPSGQSSAALVRSTQDFAQLQGWADYLFINGGFVLGGGSADFEDASFNSQLGCWEASLVVQMPSVMADSCRLVVVARGADGAAISGSAALTLEFTWP